jgi:hypothetical protein
MIMQTSAQTAPVAGLPQPTSITTVGADGKAQTIAVPKTQAEVDALVRRRIELSDQLGNVTDRRQQLVNQIRSAPDGVARTGLEDRVKVLDQRLLQLEADLSSTGAQLASSPADLVRWSEERSVSRPGNDDFEEGFAAGTFSLLFLFAVIGGWRRFRRKRRPKTQQNQIAGESDGRLERLERGMEAIAIEIERVSEGQRFVTKLLAESPALAEQKSPR